MRKYTRSLTLFLMAASVWFASCNKESNSSGVLPPTDSSGTKQILGNLFAGTRTITARQDLQVNAGALQVVYGSKNTRLIFYPNSFRDKNGMPVTSGQIQLKLTEMYTPGEVIGNRSSTVALGRLLMSGGQVHLKAYRSGQEVFPTTYGIGFVASSTPAFPPMALFYGNNNNGDSVVTWAQSAPNAGTLVYNQFVDTTNGVAYYMFDSCTSFNWINCDYFMNNSGQLLTNINLVSKDTLGLNKTNTMVFLVFPSMNAVSYMQMFTDSSRKWSLTNNYQIPVNANFHAVSLSLRNGIYYYAELKNLTATFNMMDTLRPVSKTLPEVITALGAL